MADIYNKTRIIQIRLQTVDRGDNVIYVRLAVEHVIDACQGITGSHTGIPLHELGRVLVDAAHINCEIGWVADRGQLLLLDHIAVPEGLLDDSTGSQVL